MKKFGVFDIDGTLFRSQLYHEVMLEMARSGNLPPELANKAIELYTAWRNRKTTFDDFDVSVVVEVDKVLTSIDQKAFDAAVKKVVNEQKDRVYVYTRDLIQRLKREGYYLIAISGSHSEIVEHFAKHHGFDEWVGQLWDRGNGSSTFQGIKVKSFKDKHLFLKDIIDRNKLSLAGSYAIGDSKGDISMLEMVDNPIAFNPSSELLQHAHAKGWDIVIERKTIAYTLRSQDGTYVLAETNA